MVEQHAPGDLRRRRRQWLGAARAADGMDRAIEVDRLHRIRLPRLRQGDQSAERLLRPEIERQRDALIGRSGSRFRAADICRSATTRSRASRCKRSTNIGTRTATTRSPAPACRWCSSPSPASGTGTRGRSRSSPCSRANGATPATGRRAIGSAAEGRRFRLCAPSPAPTPGPFASFPTLATAGWSAHVRPRFGTGHCRSRLGPVEPAAPLRVRLLRHRTDL